MPKRIDIQSILVIGSGPIVIGQACEFDYSGTQACKALKEEGYRVILVNSNPATIMTDPDFSDRTYIEPLNVETLEKIIFKEKPDCVLPTIGGQTALNLAMELDAKGILTKYNVELIGASIQSIEKAEKRESFKKAMESIGLRTPNSTIISNYESGLKQINDIGFPAIIRPSFTLGGTGGSIAYSIEEFRTLLKDGLEASPISEVQVDESIIGWKEFELEVVRDSKDNVVIICSIENFDPMGVHTGDSITVAPAQTLTDKQYQILRNYSIDIIREIGVDTGGSNIQFGINPKNGDVVVIEMNPRVSRSSALASKATGYPIAKIAAKLAVGYTLDELPNDITRDTPASFEPTLDYVVVKIPRFTFEKFPQTKPQLGTQMKSVGEVMSIGSTFKESLGKAMRSLEVDSIGFDKMEKNKDKIIEVLSSNNPEKLWYLGDALRVGLSVDEIFDLTKIDKWFLNNIKEIIDLEKLIASCSINNIEPELILNAKKFGFSDLMLSTLLDTEEKMIRNFREENSISPCFKMVDTCAAEFEAYTPYLYSTFQSEDESAPTSKRKVAILGSGPNRIGQGIEFDYCCVHASFSLKEEGFETIMINCNPETVSTDYDTSDKLYFEPLTVEDTLSILKKEKPEGVIVHLGGQTPLKLALDLEKEGIQIMGTSADSIDIAEDRERFKNLMNELKILQPESRIAKSKDEALQLSKEISYPMVVRPSYVLGGRSMEVVYSNSDLESYLKEEVDISSNRPLLMDQFLKDAKEIDVDALCDQEDVVICGILEHIEEAGVHSGDSTMVLPPYSLSEKLLIEIKEKTKQIAIRLKVKGLINIQFAIKDEDLYMIEVNPRASRTIPFISKAIGVPIAKIAAKVMSGRKLAELNFLEEINIDHYSVKESVFPFIKFPDVDTILGPEMKSTGEAMGIDSDLSAAFAKAQISSGNSLPNSGKAFVSVKDEDKAKILPLCKDLVALDFEIVSTIGTHEFLKSNHIESEVVKKVKEGSGNIVDLIKKSEIDILINTTSTKKEILESFSIRRTALIKQVPYFTTIAGAVAAINAIDYLKKGIISVKPLQEFTKISKV
ncbi:MAG: carbamoyl-phosphate synthase large subunit [Thermodesulfobacteriota bacterium]|nr:carbamoyl-phosphate synthase large subunit [Deltaproteobacteria bacterium TMED58]RZP16509.1 MAG: carbamoyl-phosphate synthase large subunit [Candidatus Dadabacteria bacterium]|tara:strand:- start:26091 stop:29300 length:3210 start_codon:yes stop_codon:yes gene_type:complete